MEESSLEGMVAVAVPAVAVVVEARAVGGKAVAGAESDEDHRGSR